MNRIKFFIIFSPSWRKARRLKKAGEKIAQKVLKSIIKDATDQNLFKRLKLENNTTNRFEMIVLLTSVVLGRLGAKHPLTRLIIEALISEIDDSYREIGVSDMRFAKIMKKTISMLMVRIAKYHKTKDKESLINIIANYFYPVLESSKGSSKDRNDIDPNALFLADYVIKCRNDIKHKSIDNIIIKVL